MIILSFIVALLGIGALVFVYASYRTRRHRKISEELELKLFLVKLPQGGAEEKKLQDEIGRFEQFVSILASFKKPVALEVAVPIIGEEIHFYVAVPNAFSEVISRQIQSLWSDAEVTKVDDYTVFNYAGEVRGAWIKEKDRFVLPIRTYSEVDRDTFLSLLGGFSKINELGEGGVLQIILRPAPVSFKKEILGSLHVLKKGWKLKHVLENRSNVGVGDFSDAVLGGRNNKKESTPEKVIDEAALKALEKKASKPLFEANIRVLASAPTAEQAESILRGIAAGFSQFNAPYRNEFVTVEPKDLKSLVYEFSFREFNERERVILNSEEVASIFHFPTPFTIIPKIKYLKAKEAPPPSNLSLQGALLGFSVFRGEKKEVRLSDDDRRRHVYIVGQTGTGKSTLITHMAIEDIRLGKGVAVIDPHGDLIDTILGLVPKERFDDVIVFDPSDLGRPLGLNMIEYDFTKPEQKTFIVNEMVGIFDKLYDLKVTGGPMFEQYMRNALLLLMEDASSEPATLMEVARVFTDSLFRDRKLKRIHNPTVLDFWQKEAIKAGGEAALQNMTPYITSKFNTFTANDYMRVIIGQAHSAFNVREIMDRGKILLVNLSKGRIGDLNANLLGMIMVGKILMAALGRVDTPEHERKDFYLYIDEFQNFTTDSIASILSEARKYRLNLTIAHQFIAQLTEHIRDAVFGNVGSVIAFRTGAQDAEVLVKQFEPVFTARDLTNIDNFNAYTKILLRGGTTNPFNIRTLELPKGSREAATLLKNLSRTRYGVSRETVEAETYRRLRE